MDADNDNAEPTLRWVPVVGYIGDNDVVTLTHPLPWRGGVPPVPFEVEDAPPRR